METGVPDLVLLDLGLGGSTTIGVDICRNILALSGCTCVDIHRRDFKRKIMGGCP